VRVPSPKEVDAVTLRTVLFDLDGVFFVGDTPIPGGADTVTWARQRGLTVRFVTNTTSHSRTALLAKLHTCGVDADLAEVHTPLVAAIELLGDRGIRTVAACLPAPSAAELVHAGLDVVTPAGGSLAERDVQAVVVGDLGDDWDFATLNGAFRLLLREPRPLLIALGHSRYWAGEDGANLDVGPFVAALEYATEQAAIVIGKPSAEFFLAAVAHAGGTPVETVMVGDDIRTDVGAAIDAGLRGVLVRTGKFTPTDLDRGIVVDLVLDSVADLPRRWAELGASQPRPR
jgi:phospholysine phosphohistidine inorganic pyrophosphate phosphatase